MTSHTRIKSGPYIPIASEGLDQAQLDDDLCEAVGLGKLNAIKELLMKGANINSVHSKFGLSSLVYAVKSRELETVKVLLENGARVNEQCCGGTSALHTACDWIEPPNNDNFKLVKLLTKEADIDLKDEQSYTPLYLAAKRGHSRLVRLLLEKGADANNICDKSGTALQTAAESGNLEVVRLLAEHPNIDLHFYFPWKGTALQIASEHGHLDVVKLLRQRGASINAIEECACSPLTSAARKGHIKVVKYLLEKRAKINAYDGDSTAVDTALSNGHNDIAELLIEHGAELDAIHMGETSLQRASRQGDHTAVEFLIKHGADINAGYTQCRSPLELAAQGGHEEVIRALLKQAGNTCIESHSGKDANSVSQS